MGGDGLPGRGLASMLRASRRRPGARDGAGPELRLGAGPDLLLRACPEEQRRRPARRHGPGDRVGGQFPEPRSVIREQHLPGRGPRRRGQGGGAARRAWRRLRGMTEMVASRSRRACRRRPAPGLLAGSLLAMGRRVVLSFTGWQCSGQALSSGSGLARRRSSGPAPSRAPGRRRDARSGSSLGRSPGWSCGR
jgi:hypothetical protein